MADLMLLPAQSAYTCSTRPSENFHRNGYLYAGIDPRGQQYNTLLHFDFASLPENTPVKRALLRLYSSHPGEEIHPGLPYMLASGWDEKTVTWENQPGCTDSPPGRTGAISHGWYFWDVSGLVQYWRENGQSNHGLVILPTVKNDTEEGGFRRYHPNMGGAYGNYRPAILLECEDMETVRLASREAVNRTEVLYVEDADVFSRWQNTSGYDTYTFFARNAGAKPARAHVQISPDKSSVFDEAAVYELPPGRTQAIVPQRYAFQTRLALAVAIPGTGTRIKVWFQAHV